MVFFLGQSGYDGAGDDADVFYPDRHGAAVGRIVQGADVVAILDPLSRQGQGDAHGKRTLAETEYHRRLAAHPFVVVALGSRQGSVEEDLGGTAHVHGDGGLAAEPLLDQQIAQAPGVFFVKTVQHQFRLFRGDLFQ